jgi:hypothetical protein
MGLRIEMGLSSYPVWLWEALDDGDAPFSLRYVCMYVSSGTIQ